MLKFSVVQELSQNFDRGKSKSERKPKKSKKEKKSGKTSTCSAGVEREEHTDRGVYVCQVVIGLLVYLTG